MLLDALLNWGAFDFLMSMPYLVIASCRVRIVMRSKWFSEKCFFIMLRLRANLIVLFRDWSGSRSFLNQSD